MKGESWHHFSELRVLKVMGTHNDFRSFADWEVTFSEILFENAKNGDSGLKHYINSHKIY